MQHIGHIIGREYNLFSADLARVEPTLQALVSGGSFLVIGGAGSIGQAVAREIFRRRPRRLHVIDVSENNLVELVRDIRSSLGYIDGDFRTLPLDCGGEEMASFLAAEPPYDYVLNLSALKHVRSEKDPFTLMRMIQVNVLNTEKLLRYAADRRVRKYFGVSTDKAVNPVNAMGATKSVMELCMMRASHDVPISTARFANVAFSDGSLLHGFTQRVAKRQPLSAPRDVRRYFITPEESGQLCLLSCLLGENRDVLFPKLGGHFQLTTSRGSPSATSRGSATAYRCAAPKTRRAGASTSSWRGSSGRASSSTATPPARSSMRSSTALKRHWTSAVSRRSVSSAAPSPGGSATGSIASSPRSRRCSVPEPGPGATCLIDSRSFCPTSATSRPRNSSTRGCR